ncbi:hypothetical protein INR49_008147 [Caranx melampygus]|nr:hypothetical protein INR49_008147 [Caranx melampygus]
MSFWIDLVDQEEQGKYSWLRHNGSSPPLTFTNWNKHQPASAGGCVAMSGGPALGHWEVKDCRSHKALSVCKQNVSNYNDLQLPEHHIDAYAPCPPGWESHSGLLICFKYVLLPQVFHDEKVLMKRSWVEADFFCQALGAQLASFYHYEEQNRGRWFWVESEPWVFYHGAEYLLAKQPFDWNAVSLACQMMGGHLLSVHSREELHFIKERLRRLSLGPTDWWIGLSVGQPGEEVRWSDKTMLDFQNWADGGAAAGGSRRNGMQVVGQKVQRSPRLRVQEENCVCVGDTPEPHYIGGCLLLHLPGSPKEGKSWKDAQSICSSFEGSLVSIEDEIEQGNGEECLMTG